MCALNASGFGNVPPFFTNYGAASATVSGNVTTGTQTFAGAKTWTGKQTYNFATSTGVAEALAEWNVSDDAVGKLQINNGSGTDGIFIPVLKGIGNAAQVALFLQGSVTTDTGSNGAVTIYATVGSAAAVAVRPVFTVRNGATTVMSLSAAGALSITGGTAPGLVMGGAINLKSYTVATLPASPTAGQITYASDAAGNGPCIAIGNGSVWKRCDNTATTVA